MTLLFAVAMGALALAALLSVSAGPVAALTSAAGCVLLVVVGIIAALGGAEPVLHLGGWLGFGQSSLRADPVSGIFLALTGLAGAATALAHAELPPGRWLTGLGSLLILLVAVAVGADNGFLFFLAWEGLTVCIYLLASADHDRPGELINGYFTAGLTKLGGAALLAAFGLLYGHTHSFSLSVWTHAALAPGTRGVLFALFVVAFGSKVGVLPIQGALPAGYGAAPRLGAASLSVALSAGFYGLWRFLFAVLGPLPTWCGDALLILGALTALTGVVYALTQDNLRRFLGYSTVEHAGIVLLGLGVALLGGSAHNRTLEAAGLLAATLHVCAHNLAKTLALIAVDRVETSMRWGASGAEPRSPPPVSVWRPSRWPRSRPWEASSANGSPSRRSCRRSACRRCSPSCCALWPAPPSRSPPGLGCSPSPSTSASRFSVPRVAPLRRSASPPRPRRASACSE